MSADPFEPLSRPWLLDFYDGQSTACPCGAPADGYDARLGEPVCRSTLRWFRSLDYVGVDDQERDRS